MCIRDREFAILPDEGQVPGTLGYDLRTITLASRKKLAGDEGHHARNAGGGIEDSRTILCEVQMADDLRHDFAPRCV